MGHLQLSPQMADTSHAVERSEEAAAFSEIAARMVEMEETGHAHTARLWWQKVAGLFSDPRCPRAGWVYLRLASGDLGQVTTSFAERGKKMARSRQAEQQELERAFEVIRDYEIDPRLSEALTEYLGARKETYLGR